MRIAVFAVGLLAFSACASDVDDQAQNDDTADCPVISSQNWTAWIDAEPPGPPTLHIRGDVVMPTPGYTASWRTGAADRRMPPGQTMHLSFAPPDGMVTQVVTTQPTAFSGDAVYPEYRVIYVKCGDKQLAEISEIPIAR